MVVSRESVSFGLGVYGGGGERAPGGLVPDEGAPRLSGARCDFCGHAFGPVAWNQRTCHRCAAAGAPDQSRMGWEAYQAALGRYLRANAKRPQLTGTAKRLEEGRGLAPSVPAGRANRRQVARPPATATAGAGAGGSPPRRLVAVE